MTELGFARQRWARGQLVAGGCGTLVRAPHGGKGVAQWSPPAHADQGSLLTTQSAHQPPARACSELGSTPQCQVGAHPLSWPSLLPNSMLTQQTRVPGFVPGLRPLPLRVSSFVRWV